MSSINAKDVATGKIPQVDYLIVYDKQWDAKNLALAISILASQGWTLEWIWSIGSFHFALHKQR